MNFYTSLLIATLVILIITLIMIQQKELKKFFGKIKIKIILIIINLMYQFI